jgi:glutamate 5-kinase
VTGSVGAAATPTAAPAPPAAARPPAAAGRTPAAPKTPVRARLSDEPAAGEEPPGAGRFATPRRVVVKLGTSSITKAPGIPDPERIARIATQLAELHRHGVAIVLVSSGAIAAGVAALGLERRPADMPSLQAAAAVGQPGLMNLWAEAFAAAGGPAVAQVLLTQYDIVVRTSYVNARHTLERLLELGVIPIVNENDTVAVEEIRFGENDRIAALVANIVQADLLVLLSDVEGLYTHHPSMPGATLLSTVAEVTDDVMRVAARRRSAQGSGGMTSKVEAARIASLSGVAAVIASGDRPGVVLDVCSGGEVGTFFPARRPRQSARKLWIAWAPAARGRIVVDEGARQAVAQGNKSLLAAGVRAVEGTFSAGDAVDVVGPEGDAVAKGLVAFDSTLLAELAGTKGGREVIHRDQLVVL